MKKKPASKSAFFNPRLILSFVFFSIGVFLTLLGYGAFSNMFAASSTVTVPDVIAPLTEETEEMSPADANGRFVQLIEFAELGLIERVGRTSGEQFRTDTPQARAALEQIKAEQAVHVQAIGTAIGRQPDVTHRYTMTHSGIATRLTPEEAQIVRMMPGISKVERERVYELDTFRSPFFIGADKIWDGTAVPGGVGTRGQGIVVADLDTGLVPTHPSYANDATCGHGVGGAPNKLLSSLDCASTDPSGLCNGPSPNDSNGHGSHTSSTAAGNVVPTSAVPPPAAQIQGIAPCANLRMYKVCPGSTCPGADITAGINSVLLHGDARTLNFSISGGNSPWTDNDRRFLDLVEAGIVVNASAGNTSATIPNPIGQVAHRGPWVQTVAASTKDAAGPGSGDILAGFSLRGPTAGNFLNIQKPDVTGPGVSIYAAVLSAYGTLSGTSMSCPHLTGGSALLRAVHPTWLPEEVKTALMMTSFNGGFKENGTTPWDPDDVGSGRIDLTQAAKAGLVMNETFANFLAANPNAGGNPRTLNTASVRDMNCSPSCVFTRTVRNTKTVPTSWTATGSSINPANMTVAVAPPTFNFTGSVAQTQTLTITVTPLVNLTAAVAFGQVLFTESGAVSPNERITVAIKGLPAGLVTPGTPTPTPTLTPSPTVSPTPSASPTPIVSPTPIPTVTPTPPPPAQAINLSTRMRVDIGDRVGIGGFIITGSASKQVIARAIGPSLTRFGIPQADVLADPVLELHGPAGFTTIINNNWRDNQQVVIQNTGIPPINDLESAIVATLAPGAYTAIVRGNGNTAGVALVEVYDLDQANSKLANLSTRAFGGTGPNIIIAGFMLGNNTSDDSVVVRGLGPSLSAFGVTNVMANPTLELRNGDGTLQISNNDWQDSPSQAALIIAAGLAPSNALEAAIAASLPPGLYTVLLAGLNNTTGNALVEVYDRGAGGPPGPSPTPATPSPSPTIAPGTPSPTATPSPGLSPTPTATATATVAPSPSPGGVCTENFDSVTAPALPAGWTATLVTGDPPTWVTTTASSDTAPNNAFVPDQDGISDKTLDSRTINISSAAPVITFRNNFNTEHDPPPAEVFWDGYVMEVSVNGGAFVDVTDPSIGGTFVSGGYTGEIDGTANNPLAGRQAWSGDSGGYITTTINLGAALNGQPIKLRLRMGTDEAVAAPGVHFDTMVITGGSCP
jgi:subtilisin family serine protease